MLAIALIIDNSLTSSLCIFLKFFCGRYFLAMSHIGISEQRHIKAYVRNFDDMSTYLYMLYFIVPYFVYVLITKQNFTTIFF